MTFKFSLFLFLSPYTNTRLQYLHSLTMFIKVMYLVINQKDYKNDEFKSSIIGNVHISICYCKVRIIRLIITENKTKQKETFIRRYQ